MLSDKPGSIKYPFFLVFGMTWPEIKYGYERKKA